MSLPEEKLVEMSRAMRDVFEDAFADLIRKTNEELARKLCVPCDILKGRPAQVALRAGEFFLIPTKTDGP